MTMPGEAPGLEVKICGVTTPEAVRATAGAAMIGFVFYPRSPRFLKGVQAAHLVDHVPPGVRKVGLFVDSDDAVIDAIVDQVDLDFLQLHGAESPRRVAAIKQRFAKPVIKAITLRTSADLDTASSYFDVADWLLFDARVPSDRPGGHGVSFDWEILQGRSWPLPWMLAGGLGLDNLAEAVRVTGARAVDVSSGVEDRPGHKDPDKIARFLEQARLI